MRDAYQKLKAQAGPAHVTVCVPGSGGVASVHTSDDARFSRFTASKHATPAVSCPVHATAT